MILLTKEQKRILSTGYRNPREYRRDCWIGPC